MRSLAPQSFHRISFSVFHEICPSFENPDWAFQMKDACGRDNEIRIVTWNASNNNLQNRQNKREPDVPSKKEKPKSSKGRRNGKTQAEFLQPEPPASTWIESRPAPYALGKIKALQYVELDYSIVPGVQGSCGGFQLQ
jgi:hypothetical protein